MQIAKIEGLKGHKATKDGAMKIVTNVVRKDITPNFAGQNQLKVMLPHPPKMLMNLMKIRMYKDKRKLTNLTECKGGRVVVTANNSRLPITYIGNATILPKYNSYQVELQHVYHVPGLKENLLSISQLIAFDNFVLFKPDEVKVYQNEKIIGTPVMQGKRLETVHVTSAQEAYIDKVRKNETSDLWHARLGHVSYHNLKIMTMKSMLKGLPQLDV
ncbi:hypothetical protein ACH5RR_013044 [Cinchona calisaya]|uniref:GAG-pre-integrase domain-containing protein n=1 Tax=Cinchona calisaya TaxID=153742 RepID=A0ABD3A2K7_9GENT